MANSLVQFRVDDTEKLEEMQICERLGLNLQSYLRMCLSRLVQERGIPFSMHIEEENNSFINAVRKAQQIAEENGIANMSLEEINAEIAEARKGR